MKSIVFNDKFLGFFNPLGLLYFPKGKGIIYVPFATAAPQNQISSVVGAISLNILELSISSFKEFGGYKTPPTPVCIFLKL